MKDILQSQKLGSMMTWQGKLCRVIRYWKNGVVLYSNGERILLGADEKGELYESN